MMALLFYYSSGFLLIWIILSSPSSSIINLELVLFLEPNEKNFPWFCVELSLFPTNYFFKIGVFSSDVILSDNKFEPLLSK